MALRDFLVDRCTIQRITANTQYEDGSMVIAWSDHLVDIPCRFVVQDERVASPNGLMMATIHRLIVRANQDITSADQVSQVELSDLSTQGPFTIEAVIPRRGMRDQNHLVLRVEKIS